MSPGTSGMFLQQEAVTHARLSWAWFPMVEGKSEQVIRLIAVHGLSEGVIPVNM